MNDIRSSSTLRDVREHLGHPVTLSLLAITALVLSLMGAFGTANELRFLPRLAYWLATVGVTYALGYGISLANWAWLRGRVTHIAIVALASVLTGLGVVVTVLLINGMVFGLRPELPGDVSSLLTIFAVSALVSAAIHIAQPNQSAGPAQPKKAEAPILARVPVGKRGALIALSVEDHYVRIRTTKGETMVLMRLSDAIREAAPVAGLQVHRSHWVARDHVTAARREGERAVLSFAVGRDIPVSRSHIRAVKDAGLLPR